MTTLRDTSPLSRAAGTALLLLFACAFLLGTMNGTVNVYDEGIVLVGAMRVRDGQMPHRDFYANYGPGTYLALAGLFHVFPPSVPVERLYDTAVRALVAVACFVLCRRAGLGRAAHVAYGLALLVLSLAAFYGAAAFPALACLIGGVLCCFDSANGRQGFAPPFLAGLATGAATLFRYDFGVAGLGLQAAFLALLGLRFRREGISRARAVLAALVPYACGALVLLLPLVLIYALGGALPGLLHDLWRYPFNNYAAMRALPFPGLDALRRAPADVWVYFPPIAWCLAVPALLRAGPAREADAPDARRHVAARWTMGLILCLSAALFAKGAVRVSLIHMAPAAILAAILFAYAWSAFQTSPALARLTVAVVWIGLAARLAVVAPLAYTSLRPAAAPGDLACQRLGSLRLSADRLAAVDYVRRHTAENVPIFVGTGRHDKILLNDMLFYFLADRLPATKWAHYDPGLQTTAAVQEDMIRELRGKHVPFVVLDASFDDAAEPNASAEPSGVGLLDAFLREHYTETAAFGPLRVLRRIDQP
ncbi:hypothetical protein [Solidesulfovibrio sp.]|uniref:hypothetical protein n=1 Tax=Solidesulfovibrio sp. TaxID=2910990 RepID=UPI002B21C5F9|nr:hypothetical protein [Solidesulfovibrio sp.]MEA5088104.1 hypothetical protein [Solidesulfovibrio sp.]